MTARGTRPSSSRESRRDIHVRAVQTQACTRHIDISVAIPRDCTGDDDTTLRIQTSTFQGHTNSCWNAGPATQGDQKHSAAQAASRSGWHVCQPMPGLVFAYPALPKLLAPACHRLDTNATHHKPTRNKLQREPGHNLWPAQFLTSSSSMASGTAHTHTPDHTEHTCFPYLTIHQSTCAA